MTCLYDRKGIIIDYSHPVLEESKEVTRIKILSFFENYIMMEKCIFNHNIINHYFYKNKDISKGFFEDSIINFLCQKLKETKNSFRRLNKTLNLKIEYIIDFIKTYERLITTLDSYIFNKKYLNNVPDNISLYSFGTSSLIKKSLYHLCNILLNDNCIKNCIERSIINNTNLYHYVKYLKKIKSYGCFDYDNIVKDIDNTLYNNFEKKDYHIPTVFNNIYNFRDLLRYYKKAIYNYNFVLFDKQKGINKMFTKLFELIITELCEIKRLSSVNQLSYFMKEYIKDLIFLNKQEVKFGSDKIITSKCSTNEIRYLFLSIKFKDDIIEIVQYYNSLLRIFNFDINSNYESIFKLFKENKIVNDKENIIKVTKYISRNILNSNFTENIFAYMLYFTYANSDSCEYFVKYLEQELIKRYIYFDSFSKDKYNLTVMKKYLNNHLNSKKSLYYYEKIFADMTKSNEINIKNNSESSWFNNTLVTPSVWNINIDNCFIRFDDIKNNIDRNNTFTNILFSKLSFISDNICKSKTVQMHPNLGLVEITLKGTNCHTKIKMLPIQMFMFELINKHSDKHIVKNKFIEEFKMDEVIFNNVISSLLESKVAIIKPTASKYIQLEINKNLERSELDLIDIYNKYANTEVVIATQIKNNLIHKKETIISTVINNILKTSELSFDTLYQKTKNNVKLFDCDYNLFESTINMMKQKDIISESNGTINKLLY